MTFYCHLDDTATAFTRTLAVAVLLATAGSCAPPPPADACRVGQEVGPGESCSLPGGGRFTVRDDGCVGDRPRPGLFGAP